MFNKTIPNLTKKFHAFRKICCCSSRYRMLYIIGQNIYYT